MSGAEAKFEPEPQLRILEELARRHEPSSAEHAAIELASKALLFIHSTGQATEFVTYLNQFHADLTDEQREMLARLGLQ